MKTFNLNRGINVYVLVFIFFFILYILNISHVLSISHDSAKYLNEIEKNVYLFHPHHLLYQVSNIYWLKFLLLFNLNIPTYILVTSFNCFFGALTLSLLCYLLKDIFNLGLFKSIAFTALIGFSFGFWFYSICVEVYILPIFFIVLSTIIYFKLDYNKFNIYILAIISGIAVLFHQAHLLFGLAILLNLIIKYKADSNNLIKFVSRFGIIFLHVIVIPYLIIMIFTLNLKSVNEMIFWLTTYSHELNVWNPVNLEIIPKDLTGLSRTFITPHGLLISEYFQRTFLKLFSNKNLIDDSYIVREIGSGYFIFYLSLLITYISINLFLFIKSIKYIKFIFKENKSIIYYLIIFISIYSIFFSFWDSTNQEFWIPQSILIWLLFAIITKEIFNKKYLKIMLISLIPILFFINWFFCINLTKDITNDYFYQETLEIQRKYRNSDVVLFLNKPWIIGDYIDRYSVLKCYKIMEHPANAEISETDLQKNLLAQLNSGHSVLVDFDNLISNNNNYEFKTKRLYFKFSKDSFSVDINKFYNHNWYLIESNK